MKDDQFTCSQLMIVFTGFLAVIPKKATVVATCQTGHILAADPTPLKGHIFLIVAAGVTLRVAVTQGAGPGVETGLGRSCIMWSK